MKPALRTLIYSWIVSKFRKWRPEGTPNYEQMSLKGQNYLLFISVLQSSHSLF